MSKKISLLTLLFFIGLVSVNAQGFEFGLKGGTDIQKISGSTSLGDKFAFGYHVGAYVQLKLSNKFSIQPELYYSSTKSDTSSNFSSVYQNDGIDKLKFSYINIPVLLNIKPSKKLVIQLGPQYSILSNSNLKFKDNVRNAISTGDFAAVFGLQFKFSSISIYGRYQIGLSDRNVKEVANSEKWKSQTIHIGVGLKII
jgi:hypothetical protein